MRDHNGSANNIGHRKDLIHLFGGNAQFVALTKVIFDTVITAQYHAGHQSKHFLGFLIKGTFIIRIGVQVPETF